MRFMMLPAEAGTIRNFLKHLNQEPRLFDSTADSPERELYYELDAQFVEPLRNLLVRWLGEEK